MARVGVYVTEADKAWLDQLPQGSTAAALLREAIARARRLGADCAHERRQLVCLDCGHRADAHVEEISTGSASDVNTPSDGTDPGSDPVCTPGDETAGRPGADPVCI